MTHKLLVGLIGAGIQHSLTPAMHEAEARHQGLALHYQLIDLALSNAGTEALPTLISAARMMGFAGLNITYPCKQAVIPLLDDLSDEARAMGAVNTVVIDRDGRATGHNTDGSGWAWGLRRSLPAADCSRVVLLGTGGAGSAIAHALLRIGTGALVLVDRDMNGADALAANLKALYPGSRIETEADIARALRGATGLVHATPVGMGKNAALPLPAELLDPRFWVSDVVYFPLETPLLRAARAAGCAIADGGGMAVGQAIGAFERFTGLKADPQRLEAHFRAMIEQRHNA